MSYKSAIDIYQEELSNLVRLLDGYIVDYRNLVSTLNDVNLNVLISRTKKRKAIKQVEQLGCIIDMVLEAICHAQMCYLKYVRLKCEVLCEIINCDFVRLEVEKEILSDLNPEFKNKFLTLCPPKLKSSIKKSCTTCNSPCDNKDTEDKPPKDK